MPEGWGLVPYSSSIATNVVANYGFGTHTVLFSDGSEYRTNNLPDAGTRFGCCYLQTDGTNHRVRAGCSHKVLMRREATETAPTPAFFARASFTRTRRSLNVFSSFFHRNSRVAGFFSMRAPTRHGRNATLSSHVSRATLSSVARRIATSSSQPPAVIEQQCSGLCGSFRSALWAAVALNFVLGLLHTICAALGFIACR